MARQIAIGDRTSRVTEAPIREIGALAAALNEMADRIEVFEVELAEKNRLAALGELATHVAHEVRNPLTAIKLQVQMLKEQLRDGDTTIADRLLKEIERLDLVVASALGLGRPVDIKPVTTQLNDVVGEILAIIEPQFRHRSITLERDLEDVPPVALDSDRFKQVIFNVLTNAADELSGGGTIRVSTRANMRDVMLIVEDSGSGVPDALLEILFNSAVNTGKSAGLGIGLMISKELVELHNGAIGVDRSPDLDGARFTISIPLQ